MKKPSKKNQCVQATAKSATQPRIIQGDSIKGSDDVGNYYNTQAELAQHQENEHISKWDGKSSVNLAPEMMAITLEIVSQCLFGLESSKYTAQIAHSMEIAIDRIERTMLPGLERFDKSALSYFVAFEEAANQLADIAEEIIQTRIASNTTHSDDLLGILLQMREHISMEHIRDEVLTLILSGHETTANVLTWAFSYMSNNPKAAADLAKEADQAQWIKEKRVPTFAELEASSTFATSVLI